MSTGHDSVQSADFEVPGLTEWVDTLLADPHQGTSVPGGFTPNDLQYVISEPLPPPKSAEYADAVLRLYETASRRKYTPHETELFEVSLDDIDKTSFPFSTGEASMVSMYYSMLGTTFAALKGMPRDARVLEFGPGWGETTMAMARLGYDVTCIEINPGFIKLINQRAERSNLGNVHCIEGDFSEVSKTDKTFDLVLFFECFHHALHHVDLLRECVSRLSPHGKIVFAGEPVTAEFPVPWGLRLDTQSLFCISKHGWLELGFNEAYFRELLMEAGLVAVEEKNSVYTFFSTFICAKELIVDFSTAPLGTQVGKAVDGGVAGTDVAGVLVYGPYWRLDPTRYRLICECDYTPIPSQTATLAIKTDLGAQTIAQVELLGNRTELEFELTGREQVEFTIFTTADAPIIFNRMILSLAR